MSFQNNEESDFDFSVIDKKSTRQEKLNFSVESLLEQRQDGGVVIEREEENEEVVEEVGGGMENDTDQQGNMEKGSFLQDLQKLQDQLSFQTQIYNIYNNDQASIINSQNPQSKSNFYAKSNSNLKTTKQESNSHSIDDYGYLVIDFAPKNKTKKTSLKVDDLSKLSTQHYEKLHTHSGTVSSGRFKMSESLRSNSVLESQSKRGQKGVEGKCLKSKSKNKTKSIESTALKKLLSPPQISKQKSSSSKQKIIIKPIKTKLKTQVKQQQSTIRNQKSPHLIKTLSKSKSPSTKTLFTIITSKSSKNAATARQSVKMQNNKSNTRSTNRDGNVYSEYYGFDGIGGSQRQVMKPNCIYTQSENLIKSPNTKKIVAGIKSKSKCKKGVHSPLSSNKQLAIGFKKKKAVQNF